MPRNRTTRLCRPAPLRRHAGFTLTEVVVSLAISLVTITSIFTAYHAMARRSLWSGCVAAANTALSTRMEQVRAARWDPLAATPVDELTTATFPVSVLPLALPISGENVILVTNITTIQTLRTDPPLKLIRIDCSWEFPGGNVYSNSLVTYRSPDP